MFPRHYNSNVLVGNWEENKCTEQVREQQYAEKVKKGELLIQKLRNATALFNHTVELSVITDGYIHFGDTVKICHDGRGLQFSVAMASNISLHSLLKSDDTHLDGSLSICAMKNSQPIRRNVFTVTSKEDCTTYKRPLHFGETFYLHTPVLSHDWCLCSNMITFGRSTDLTQHQEILLCPNMTRYGKWKVVHPNPEWSMEKEGSPVPVNENVIINHVFTNQALALENHQIKTIFGDDYEVSAHTYSTGVKHVADRRNLWKFVSASPIL